MGRLSRNAIRIGLGALTLSCFAWSGWSIDAIRAIYVDGRPVAATSGARYSNVDVELGRDGIVRITSRPAPGRPDAPATVPTSRPGAATTAPPADTTSQTGPSSAPAASMPASPESRLPLEGRYWIALHDIGRTTGWTVTVTLNGQSVGEFSSGETRVVEVTPLLKRGDNTARLTFRPRMPAGSPPADGTAPASPGAFEIVLAPGKVQVDQNEISLSYPIFSSRRTDDQPAGPAEELEFSLPPPNLP